MEPSHPPDIVLHCFDPFGREVTARRGQWESHIENGHPEVDEHFGVLEATIRHPERINADATYPNRENFYRRGVLPPPYDRLHLKVCVGFGPGNLLGTFTVGPVIMAYPTKGFGRGETQRWP